VGCAPQDNKPLVVLGLVDLSTGEAGGEDLVGE
jgi:hypothetical protein